MLPLPCSLPCRLPREAIASATKKALQCVPFWCSVWRSTDDHSPASRLPPTISSIAFGNSATVFLCGMPSECGRPGGQNPGRDARRPDPTPNQLHLHSFDTRFLQSIVWRMAADYAPGKSG
ncbi:hypothetical protein [Paraburkholderia mimosarum]|uniref:hypothetical protein n=1 Tax=Paraburkholderia mimosarum TaxID=312026 RepID=UPI0012E0A8D4|nr:hypothetical protein [Paraburkholderia mimosarum]